MNDIKAIIDVHNQKPETVESIRQQIAETQEELRVCQQEAIGYREQLAECQARKPVAWIDCKYLPAIQRDGTYMVKMHKRQTEDVHCPLYSLPSDSTALDQAIQQALRPVYDFVGRDYAHLEPKEALETWNSKVTTEAKRDALLERADFYDSIPGYEAFGGTIADELREKAKELE